MPLTKAQMLEMLEHDDDMDLWLIDKQGNTIIHPATDDLAAFQDPSTWPKYICRSQTVNQFVKGLGEDKALAWFNTLVDTTLATTRRPSLTALSTLARLAFTK